jgi:hypothetical protein
LKSIIFIFDGNHIALVKLTEQISSCLVLFLGKNKYYT